MWSHCCATQTLCHLREDGHGDLRGCPGADVQAHGSVDARQCGVVEPARPQTLDPASVGLAAAEGANIEGTRRQGRGQGYIVEFRIVGERHHRTTAVQTRRLERFAWSLRRDRDIGKACLAGEGAARVDHQYLVARTRRHRRELLGDVDGSDDHQARWRIEGLYEDRLSFELMDARRVPLDRLAQRRAQPRIAGPTVFVRAKEFLASRIKPGDQHDRSPRCTRGEKLLE